MSDELQSVRVVDIEMPFSSMVGFMVKWAFATIPAVIVIGGLIFIIFLAAAAFGVALTRH
jgi:hypothetical protein